MSLGAPPGPASARGQLGSLRGGILGGGILGGGILGGGHGGLGGSAAPVSRRLSLPHSHSASALFPGGGGETERVLTRGRTGNPSSPPLSCRSLSPEPSLTSGCLPSNRSPSPESARDSKKRTCFSGRMQSGDDMRQALSHDAPPRMRRMMSMPPLRKNDDEMSIASVTVVSPRTARGSLPVRVVTASAASADSDRGATPKRTAVRSPQPASRSYDLRAKPQSGFSVASSDSGAGVPWSARGGASQQSPRAGQDHLWRELFHEEADEQRVARLRGEGATIGSRGKASAGIPWRQIPAHNRLGQMTETGDPYLADHTKRAVGMDYKKKAVFSGKLGASNGIKSTLGILTENCENTPPPPEAQSPRQAWLAVVRRRQEAKFFDGGRTTVPQLQPQPQPQGPQPQGPQPQGPPPLAAEAAADLAVEQGSRADLHHQYRQQRKTVYPPENIRDACPYSRNDSAPETRITQPPTPHRRGNLSPQGRLSGVGWMSPREAAIPEHEPPPAAERVSEARRDWQYCQDRVESGAIEQDASPQDSSLGSGLARSASSRSMMTRNSSVRSFSPQTQGAVHHPVHSIRARPAGPQRPRWK